jgi:hypothetical protein
MYFYLAIKMTFILQTEPKFQLCYVLWEIERKSIAEQQRTQTHLTPLSSDLTSV